MTLNTTIYHHHKVRATGCMLKSIMENCKDLDYPTAFLDYVDDDIYTLSSNASSEKMLRTLKSRKLPKRALVISSRTIEMSTQHNFNKIMKLVEQPTYCKKLIEVIVEQINKLHNEDLTGCIWLDIPNTPKFKEAITCVIKNYSTNSPYITLKDVFPIDDWVNAFSENKWNAYVFTEAKYSKIVSEVSLTIFEQLFEIKFNEYAQTICKISP